MQRRSFLRRDLSKLAAAAFSGVVAGSLAVNLTGCGQPSGAPAAAGGANPATASADGVRAEAHACAGLNGCKGQGVDGKNACAGQGGCASPSMHHECKGHNACKGQGGGETAGANACKGQGGCAVPIKDPAAWKMARESFESNMKAAGKDVGSAPATAPAEATGEAGKS